MISLVFDNDIELADGDEGDFWFEVLSEGLSWGDAAPVEVVVASLLADGSLVEREGHTNREVTFSVRINSTDPVGLARGRARLDGALGKRTTLVWRDDDYPATVFDVETSSIVTGQFDDFGYRRNEQVVTLRLVCQPFTRSESLVVDDAGTPPSAGGTLLLNCESTTGWATWVGSSTAGWTKAVDSTIYVEGAGSLRTSAASSYIQQRTALSSAWWRADCLDEVTGLSIDTGTGGYLSIAIRIEHSETVVYDTPGLKYLYMQVGGSWVQVPSFVATRTEDPSFTYYAWAVDAGLTVTGLRFQVAQIKRDNSGNWSNGFSHNPYTWYDDLELLPSATTDKQIVKQLEVRGSARTTGSLLVAAPSDGVALGHVLAITAPTSALPAGYTPDGRRWVVQGTTNTELAAPNGTYYSDIASTYSSSAGKPIFDMPASLFTPGPYMAVVCGRPTTSTPFIGVQAQLRVGSTDSGVLSKAENTFSGASNANYQFLPLGTLYLPPTPILTPTESVKVRMLFAATDFRLDNLYLIPAWQVGGRPVADFTIVDCGRETVGTAAASSHFWIDSPSADQPQGGYWRGPSASKALARAAWPDVVKPGLHVFEPGDVTAFVVSTDAQGPRVELSYYPAWHGSAAE